MLTFIFMAFLVVGNGLQVQDKYEYCKKKNFEPQPYCKVQKAAFEASK